jgi:hypothetical protein
MTDFTVYPSDVFVFQLQLHISSVLDTSANLLAIWLIVTKSPGSMKTYKWFLLNVVITSMLFDGYVSTFMVPYPLFPVIGYCSVGLMSGLGLFWGACFPIVSL